MYATETDSLWKSLLVEFLGTFVLVFAGASAASISLAAGGSLLATAFAFGLALMALIYIWGQYSGAHFNPAVSFGFAVAGQMNWGLMLGYWIAQLLGGIAAAALVVYFFGTANGSVGTLTNTDAWKATLMVAILTFFLVTAYLFIYRNPMLAIISGLAIGMVLTVSILAGGALVGGINPSAALGVGIFSNNMGSIWIYIVGPLLGALVAALIYKLFTANFDCCYKVDDCGKRIKDECGNDIMTCERPCLDKCGKPITDSCGKVKTEKVEVIGKQHGYKQETLGWLHKHGIDEHHLERTLATGGCATGCGLPPVVTAKPAVLEIETIQIVTEQVSTPAIQQPEVVMTGIPVVTPIAPLNSIAPSTVAINDIKSSVASQRSVVPQGMRTQVRY